MQSVPDYSAQLERLIDALSRKDALPAWEVSLVSVFVGSIATIIIGIWKERYEEKLRLRRAERRLYGELVSNYAYLLRSITYPHFHEITLTDNPFKKALYIESLKEVKKRLDGSPFDISNFGTLEYIFNAFADIATFGGPSVVGLVLQTIFQCEEFVSVGYLNGKLMIEMAASVAPEVKSRLVSLVNRTIEPGKDIVTPG